MKNKGFLIEILILENTPHKQNFTQKASILALMLGENGVDDKPMKESKGGVANGSGLKAI